MKNLFTMINTFLEIVCFIMSCAIIVALLAQARASGDYYSQENNLVQMDDLK